MLTLFLGVPTRVWEGFSRCKMWPTRAITHFSPHCDTPAEALTLGVSYTYSHSIDDASDRSDPVLVNSYDLRENRASSNFDERHLVNISYVYQLPLKDFPRRFMDWANDGPERRGRASGKLLLRARQSAS